MHYRFSIDKNARCIRTGIQDLYIHTTIVGVLADFAHSWSNA
jgi:hypothetical protein